MNQLFFFCAILMAYLTGMASPPAGAQTVDIPDAYGTEERVHLRAGELPAVTLTRDILFHLLVAELSAHRGDFDRAAEVFVELARTTMDPRLAERGFQAALASRNPALTTEAASLWADLDPTSSEAQASFLALASSSEASDDLAEMLAQRLAEADDKEQALIQASAIVSRLDDKHAALEILDQAIGPDERSLPMARLALADAAWAAQETKRAYEESRMALKLDDKLDAAAQRVLEYGLVVDPDQAIADTQAWAAEHPGSRRLHLMLVSRLVDRDQFDDALDVLSRMREQAPEDFDLLYSEAEVLARAERYDEATQLLNDYISVQTQRRQSLHDDQTNAQADASDARLLLVTIAEKQEDYKEALAQLDAIDDPALAFQAQVHKAVLQGRMGSIPNARKTLNRLKPESSREESVIALTLASIYRQAGRTDDAVKVLEAANQDLPDTPEIKYDLALLYERQGRIDDVVKHLRRVIELEPDNANAYNALGYTFTDHERDLDEAEALLEHALNLEPDNPYILDSVGWYFYRMGDLDAALEYLERSYRKMPSAEVAAHLGEVLWAREETEEAHRIWQEGHDNEPDNQTLQDTLKRFGVSLP